MPTPAARETWLHLAAEVGLLVAPAGLNFVTGGTTDWLYAANSRGLAGLVPAPWVLHPTNVRVAFDADALRRELPRLSDADARWRAGLTRARSNLPAPNVARPLLRRLDATARELPEFALREFVLRSAALLENVRLIAEYHRPEGPEPGYAFDMLENGLTLLRVELAVARR